MFHARSDQINLPFPICPTELTDFYLGIMDADLLDDVYSDEEDRTENVDRPEKDHESHDDESVESDEREHEEEDERGDDGEEWPEAYDGSRSDSSEDPPKFRVPASAVDSSSTQNKPGLENSDVAEVNRGEVRTRPQSPASVKHSTSIDTSLIPAQLTRRSSHFSPPLDQSKSQPLPTFDGFIDQFAEVEHPPYYIEKSNEFGSQGDWLDRPDSSVPLAWGFDTKDGSTRNRNTSAAEMARRGNPNTQISSVSNLGREQYVGPIRSEPS